MTDSELYPGLDAELDKIYQQNVNEGIAQPTEDVAVSGLEALLEEQLQTSQPEAARIPEVVRDWANPQLVAAMESWHKYDTILMDSLIPSSVEELSSNNPNFAATLERLYQARELLINSGQSTPEGTNVGETMRLALIPWERIKDHLGQPGGGLETLIKQLRDTQGAASSEDYINSNLLAAINNDSPIYRNPENPSELLTTAQYLDRRIGEDGPWGIMLVQTSDDAGTNGTKDKSPNILTDEGKKHLEIDGQTVDSLGIFEWLALTFQEDPKQLSSKDVSWLLANRLDVNGTPFVPVGVWSVARVRSRLGLADFSDDDWRPRLAVM